jgi:leucyl aminopeptidase
LGTPPRMKTPFQERKFFMQIHITTQTVRDLACDALILGATQNTDGQSITLTKTGATINQALDQLITARCSDGDFKGNSNDVLLLYPMEKLAAKRVIVVGLGSPTQITPHSIQRAYATAARRLQKTGSSSIALAIDLDDSLIPTTQSIQAQIEGLLLGLYTFRAYKTNHKESSGMTQIQLCVDEQHKTLADAAVNKARILADATNAARTLINEPPNVLTPTELAQRAITMAKEVGLEYEIFDKAKITALGMGGLLAVSQGSAQPPHFIILRYRGAPKTTETLGLVGKGITFDTGGISIKPAEHMDEMKGDMGGAAAVFGTMQAIAYLKPHLNVTGLIPTCENMPGSTAYRPGDILRMMNGKTMEIVNTDAEGRLILADALAFAAKEGLSPIIDLATLTGAIVIALGNTITGLFSNNGQLASEIIAAGHHAGEKYWQMPLDDDDFKDAIESEIADIKQTGGRPASSITAAKMLQYFVDSKPWAHLDIAGTSYVDSKKPYQEKGGTGVGVRTLVEFVLQHAQSMSDTHRSHN